MHYHIYEGGVLVLNSILNDIYIFHIIVYSC